MVNPMLKKICDRNVALMYLIYWNSMIFLFICAELIEELARATDL